MSPSVAVVLAQLNPLVGDVDGNLEQARDAIIEARDEMGARLVVLPEMFLCGYPPEDLLFHAGLRRRTERALAELSAQIVGVAFVIGFPEYANGKIYNAAAVFDGGNEIARYRKWLLPNYQVFDEKRYFEPGDMPCVFDIDGVRFGLTICEDIWEAGPTAAAAAAGADCVLSINGSPTRDTCSSGARTWRASVRRKTRCR